MELELQSEELQESRAQMEAALRSQDDLYDAGGVGCSPAPRRPVTPDCNPPGAPRRGWGPHDCHGARLADHLSADSKRTLAELITRALAGEAKVDGTLALRDGHGEEHTIVAYVRGEPAIGRCFVVLAERAELP